MYKPVRVKDTTTHIIDSSYNQHYKLSSWSDELMAMGDRVRASKALMIATKMANLKYEYEKKQRGSSAPVPIRVPKRFN
jgi:hypothetical protein